MLEVDADPDGADSDGTGADGRPQETRRKKKKRRWRRVLVGLLVAALLAAGFAVFAAWARAGYFIAFDDNGEAIIYGGRSGGVLWIEPTAETEGGPTADELADEAVAEIETEPRFDTFGEAAAFLIGSAAPDPTTTTTSRTSAPTTTRPPTTPTASGP